MDLRASFGTNLRQQRRLQQLTQAELAERAGMSLDMLSRLERGRAAPSFDMIETIARAMRISPLVLFGARQMAASDRERLRALQAIQKHLSKASTKAIVKAERILRSALDD